MSRPHALHDGPLRRLLRSLRKPKVHLHEDQFDGVPHAWCGRATHAVSEEEFEATEPRLRCKVCAREWFPNGQPDWHFKAAVERLAKAKT